MECIHKDIKFSGSNFSVKIEGIGDMHIGNACVSYTGIRKVVKEISEESNSYWIGMGDYFDSVTLSDPRFKIGQIDKNFRFDDVLDDQYLEGVKLLRPIKDKCLGILEGNHEENVGRRYGTNLAKRMAIEFGVPYLGYDGFVSLHFTQKGGKARTLNIYATHGHGGGRKPGAKINRLSDAFNHYPADIVLMGHSHEMLSYASPSVMPQNRGRKIKHHHRIGMITSSFLKKHTSADDKSTTYVERAGYPPVAIGRSYVEYFPISGRKACYTWVEDGD